MSNREKEVENENRKREEKKKQKYEKYFSMKNTIWAFYALNVHELNGNEHCFYK